MKARIIENKLSDGSEVYKVRVTRAPEFTLDFDMCDYGAALNFAAAFENGGVSDCDIFNVSNVKHSGLKPI